MDNIIKTVAEMEQFIDENSDCVLYISKDLNEHLSAMLAVPEKCGINAPRELIDAFFATHDLIGRCIIKGIKVAVAEEETK